MNNKYRSTGGSFLCFSPPPSKFPLKVQTSLIERKTFFHNKKLSSIKMVFCLNKTFFTHFDYTMLKLTVFVTQIRKLFNSSIRQSLITVKIREKCFGQTELLE